MDGRKADVGRRLLLAGLKRSCLPGDAGAHACRLRKACGENGLTELSVWRQTLSPGAATPPHRHDCDEVVLCLGGWGEVHTEGRVQRFGPDCTVVLPAHRGHQLFNVGPLPLEVIGIFAATPVITRLPDGTPMDLPWRS